ncbi:MAG: hypothetical protein M1818_008532 [Claussenomyces sp. TS43310]|nr:MAG: hypothetical protein M1818_008532 [Claussenomyces sp. TS43310]
MSYQYPPLPSSGPDIEDQDPTFMNNTHLPAIVPPPYPQSHGFTKPPSPSRNRAAAATSKNAKMRRSISSPNVRGQAVADAAALASAEKRRNKLGYHRTSVACRKSDASLPREMHKVDVRIASD